ncbi:MAG: nucleotidyltransferase domain-containing protein, partial [Thermoprotei archaeon]
MIIGEFSKGFTERIHEVLELVGDIPLPIEPFPYTLDEALNLLRRGSPTIY